MTIAKGRVNDGPSQIGERPSPPLPINSVAIPPPLTREQDTINEIFAIRVANNVPWKRLMEIALKHAPDETRAVLREINANDRKVSDLLGELAK